jgi:hypothetical protein
MKYEFDKGELQRVTEVTQDELQDEFNQIRNAIESSAIELNSIELNSNSDDVVTDKELPRPNSVEFELRKEIIRLRNIETDFNKLLNSSLKETAEFEKRIEFFKVANSSLQFEIERATAQLASANAEMDKLKDGIRNIDAISSVEGTIDQDEFLFGMAQGARVCRLVFDQNLEVHEKPTGLKKEREQFDELNRKIILSEQRNESLVSMNREFIDANSKLQKELFELGIQFEASKEHTKHLVDIIDNIAFVVVEDTSKTSKDVMALVERARTFKQS